MLNRKNKMVFGCLGILGVIVTIISDLILMSRPSSGKEFLYLGIENMAYLSHIRIILGVFIGIFALPFQILAVVLIYDGLNKSKKTIKILISGLFAHGLALGIAFHTAYAFLAGGYKAYISSEATKTTQIMIDKFNLYWELLIILIFVEISVASILLVIEILKGNSRFSKLIAILNPTFLAIIVFLIVANLPYPIGGIVGPTSANFVTFIFFVLALISSIKDKNPSDS